jgi:ketosteroid isomerase-like protein
MSRENAEKVRAYLETFDSEALSRGQVDCPFLAPDATYADDVLPDHVGDVYRGREAMGRAGQVWLEPYERHSIELERVIDAGDCVVSVLRFRATARHTGVEHDLPLAWLFRFHGAEVVHWHAYQSEEEALEAAESLK